MNDFSLAQALPDQVEMQLRGGNPPCGFFLERVQHIQHALEANGIDGAISVAAETVANFKNAAPESLERLRACRMIPELRFKKRQPDFPPRYGRKLLQVAPAGPDKDRRLDPSQQLVHRNIVIIL